MSCEHGVPKNIQCSECMGCKCSCHYPDQTHLKRWANYAGGVCIRCFSFHDEFEKNCKHEYEIYEQLTQTTASAICRKCKFKPKPLDG